LGTRMNTDYQDIKSYKNQISVKICENPCPNSVTYEQGKRKKGNPER
jgi:hypothetical protein